MDALRCHAVAVDNPFARGSVSSACMHYGGLVGDHTTASMVVSLEKDRTVVWSTGCSLPCVSLFKPWLFGTEQILPVTAPEDPEGLAYWQAAEDFRRSLLGKELPREYYVQRDALQQQWIRQAEEISPEAFPAFSAACLREETQFYNTWKEYTLPAVSCAPGFLGRWGKKNAARK